MPRPRPEWKTNRTCPECQTSFLPRKITSTFCSKACFDKAQSLKPGTPCRACGSTERVGKKQACGPCSRSQAKAYAEKNHEKKLAATRNWRERNKERVLEYAKNYRAAKPTDKAWKSAYSKAYWEKNRDRLLAQHSEYYRRNKEKHLANFRKWRAANTELHKTYVRKWMEKNPERLKTYKTRRRAGRGLAPISEGLFTRLMAEQGGKCPCCGGPLDSFHVDHKVPLSRGGGNNDDNLQLMRPECNLRKGTKTMEEFLAWKERAYDSAVDR